jgi:hypothetical protein
LQIQPNFDAIINRQQGPFSGAVAGEQAIKIQSSITFCEYFSVFLLIFLFHLLVLTILKKKKINLI